MYAYSIYISLNVVPYVGTFRAQVFAMRVHGALGFVVVQG